MGEIKIVFAGSVGSGKTTAIRQLSDFDPIQTESKCTDEVAGTKETTTVAMDYGEVDLGTGEILRLYGTPGQRRFRHMWEILCKEALGIIIMIDNNRPLPLSDLQVYLDNFAPYIKKSAAVIGVTRTDLSQEPGIDEYYRVLEERDEVVPIMTVDARQKDDVLLLLEALLTVLELQDEELLEMN